MKWFITISSNDPETAYNAMLLANVALNDTFPVIAREVRPKQSPENKGIASSFVPHSSQ